LEHVAAFFTFEAQGLFFGGFGEFVLKRVFLSAVALFFSFVVAFAFGQGSAFSSLVEAYGVNLMSFTLWTVCTDLFGNVHAVSLFGFAIEKTFALLYFFCVEAHSLCSQETTPPL
jgi:hypothetical protein